MRWARPTLAVMIFLLGLLQAAPGLAAPAAPADDLTAQARRVLELTNQERSKAGVTALQWNDILAATATDYAKDLVDRQYFSHTSKEGTMPWDRAKAHGYPTYGWGSAYVGENLAQGFATPEDALKGWMNSEAHRVNLLKPEYRELGVGVVADASGRKTWVQNFGSRPGVLTVVINGKAPTTDSPQVTLSISSEEVSSWGSVGKPAQMMVSNRPDFAGSSWEPYAQTRSWVLSSQPGVERVYVRVKDDLGTVVDSSDEVQMTGRKSLAQNVSLVQPAESSAPIVLHQLQMKPEYRLGFKALADQVPEVVGQPLEDEHGADNGDSIQRTTNGLLVWRKADNWTAFTDGSSTWVNGPQGLQSRSNAERFPWEEQ